MYTYQASLGYESSMVVAKKYYNLSGSLSPPAEQQRSLLKALIHFYKGEFDEALSIVQGNIEFHEAKEDLL